MTLYIVVRRGIYDQGIYGVYSTFRRAINACKRAKDKENDDYHTFEIRKYELNIDGYCEDEEIFIKNN